MGLAERHAVEKNRPQSRLRHREKPIFARTQTFSMNLSQHNNGYSGQTDKLNFSYTSQFQQRPLWLLWVILIACTLFLGGNNSFAASASNNPEERKNLDLKLQELKKKVLELNRDLTIIEEELLYPSTQVALFLSLDVGTFIRLVDVNLTLDGKHIGYHFYTDDEFESLRKGAVHRLFTGNTISGKHQLTAVITGYGPDGKQYQETTEYSFVKEANRKFIELKVVDSSEQNKHVFEFREWD